MTEYTLDSSSDWETDSLLMEFTFPEKLVKSYLDEHLLLLIALHEGATGKELLHDLHTVGCSLSPGTVYPHLHDLADEGILEVHEKVRSKEYRIDDTTQAYERIHQLISLIGRFHRSLLRLLAASDDDSFSAVDGQPTTDDFGLPHPLVRGSDDWFEEHERQLGTLHETTRQLMLADDREEIAQIVADAANTILGYASTVVRLVYDGVRLRPVAVTEQARTELGSRPDYPLENDNPVSQAYASGEPLYYDNVAEIKDEHDRGEAQSAMYLPMGEHGVVSIVDSTLDAFDQSDIELASILVMNAETALDRLADERELERQNERLDEFVNVVSHDLRNPLNVAHGWLDAADGEVKNEKLQRVENALNRMNEIIDDTLTLARQGQTVAEMEHIDITHLAGECWDMVSTGNAELVIDDEFSVHGDRDRLQHVFENLFRNAVEHGGEDITVTIGTLDREGFYVEDNGTGIPPDERETIFEPGHTTASGGTGLGLPIVKQIAGAHGWQVRVTDGTTGGARFEFTGVEIAASTDSAINRGSNQRPD